MKSLTAHSFFIGIACAIFLFVVPRTEGGKILALFPISSKSMTNFFRPLVKGLADQGHQVKAVTPVKLNIQSENYTEFRPLSLEEIFTTYPDPFEIRRNAGMFKFPVEFLSKNCHKLFQNAEFRALERERYDVIIVNWIYHDCFAGLMYKMKSPIVFLGSFAPPTGLTSVMGNHLPPSFVAGGVLADISRELNFIQRTKNLLHNVHFSIMLEMWTKPPLQEIYREYLGTELPSINEIYRERASMVFMNTHFSITNPRPLLPSLVEVGGMHCLQANPLPKDLEEFVSGTSEGFIVFSLGSIVRASAMPESVRQAFVQSFAKLKQRVVWKWEKDEGMPDLPENVKLVKWLPQQDILGHPNIKLFITHGGLLSTEEAIYHGVPVLGMPVFIDQDANMRQAEILGFGVKGEIIDLTESKLTPLIRRILDDPRYMSTAKELSSIFRDQKETPVERAVYWTEYVMRHNGAYHLRSPAINLSLIQYHSVDVVAFLFLTFITSLLFLYYIVKIIFRSIASIVSSKRLDSRRKKALKIKKNF